MSERHRVFHLLRRYGWNTTSFQVLRPGFSYWFSADGEAAVAYADTGRHWMAAGSPICAGERLAAACLEFSAAARAAGRRPAFFGALDRLVRALEDQPFDALIDLAMTRLGAFRERLRPHGWEPVFLVAHGRLSAGTVWATLSAFAGGRIDRFAWLTARKGLERLPALCWRRAALALAAGLVPWIGVLLAADSARWFGASWLAAAWASFDAAVAAALVALAVAMERGRRWGRPLARVLLGAVLADAWLTLAQALLYNAPRASGPWDWLVLLAAAGAPPLAALYLAALASYGPWPEGA